MYERAVTVAWQASDLASFSPPSAPVLRLAAQTNVPMTSASTKISSTPFTGAHGSSSTPPSTHKDHALSTGAAAGIGVGATIGGIALIAGILWFFLRRYRLVRRTPQENLENDAKTSEINSDKQLAEAPDTIMYEAEHPPAEADHQHVRSELA